ncbi:unnamed protein product, partial [Discosporangium mesarthrocarpum]
MRLWRYHCALCACCSATAFCCADTRFTIGGLGLDDAEYQEECEDNGVSNLTCLVKRPHGALAGEFELRLEVSDDGEDLIVEVFSGKTGQGGWVSLGISPNGRMAGPSEAVVGIGSDQHGGRAVARYRMDGYRVGSVSLLPEHQQVLKDVSVRSSGDGGSDSGSVTMRFRRPFKAPAQVDNTCGGEGG